MLYVASTSAIRSSQFYVTDDCQFISLTSIVNVDHDYLPSLTSLTQYSENVVEYIAGYVVKSVIKVLHCVPCTNALTDSSNVCEFIKFKNKGSLINPSSDVIKICKLTEKCYRECVSPNLNSVLKRNIPLTIAKRVMDLGVFECLKDHALDLDPLDTHINKLVQIVSSTYQKIRLHHSVSESNRRNIEHRSTYNKLAIFKHL
jgi:hypothetical protein